MNTLSRLHNRNSAVVSAKAREIPNEVQSAAGSNFVEVAPVGILRYARHCEPVRKAIRAVEAPFPRHGDGSRRVRTRFMTLAWIDDIRTQPALPIRTARSTKQVLAAPSAFRAHEKGFIRNTSHAHRYRLDNRSARNARFDIVAIHDCAVPNRPQMTCRPFLPQKRLAETLAGAVGTIGAANTIHDYSLSRRARGWDGRAKSTKGMRHGLHGRIL